MFILHLPLIRNPSKKTNGHFGPFGHMNPYSLPVPGFSGQKTDFQCSSFSATLFFMGFNFNSMRRILVQIPKRKVKGGFQKPSDSDLSRVNNLKKGSLFSNEQVISLQRSIQVEGPQPCQGNETVSQSSKFFSRL